MNCNPKMLAAAALLVGSTLVAASSHEKPALTLIIGGNGMVVSDPDGIACPTDCNETFRRKKRVTLTAVPETGAIFIGWSGACAGTEPTCSLSLSHAAASVTATFSTLETVPPAPVPQTGQTKCYSETEVEIDCAGTGQDGAYRAGVPWPTPRFADNLDGTVRDNLTGLLWLKDANCFGAINHSNAFAAATALGNGACGLQDGSVPGDWRVPNVREMLSLVDYSKVLPALPAGNPFEDPGCSTATQPQHYHSSSVAMDTDTPGSSYITVSIGDGEVRRSSIQPNILYCLWPVR
ncbi:MAG: hypothetical protein NFCOHLIN_01094 [Gammaproteobacteria bacterium]|nr:hypothetical protein [Gammaproteobacteria bacterium]